MKHINNICNKKVKETTFTFPKLPIDNINIEKNPDNEKIFAVENFIKRNYDKNFKLDSLHYYKALELIQNIDKTGNNNIAFKPLLTSKNERGKQKVVLIRDNGKLQ